MEVVLDKLSPYDNTVPGCGRSPSSHPSNEDVFRAGSLCLRLLSLTALDLLESRGDKISPKSLFEHGISLKASLYTLNSIRFKRCDKLRQRNANRSVNSLIWFLAI